MLTKQYVHNMYFLWEIYYNTRKYLVALLKDNQIPCSVYNTRNIFSDRLIVASLNCKRSIKIHKSIILVGS